MDDFSGPAKQLREYLDSLQPRPAAGSSVAGSECSSPLSGSAQHVGESHRDAHRAADDADEAGCSPVSTSSSTTANSMPSLQSVSPPPSGMPSSTTHASQSRPTTADASAQPPPAHALPAHASNPAATTNGTAAAAQLAAQRSGAARPSAPEFAAVSSAPGFSAAGPAQSRHQHAMDRLHAEGMQALREGAPMRVCPCIIAVLPWPCCTCWEPAQ